MSCAATLATAAKVVKVSSTTSPVRPTIEGRDQTEGTGNGGNPKPRVREARSEYVVKDTAAIRDGNSHAGEEWPRWLAAGPLQPRETDESQ